MRCFLYPNLVSHLWFGRLCRLGFSRLVLLHFYQLLLHTLHRTQWFLLQQNMNIKAKMHHTLSVTSLQISQLSVSAFSIDLNQNITCRVCWRILICPFFSSSSADMSALTDSTWGVQIANKHLHPKFKSLLSYIRWEMHCYLISVGIGLAGPLLTLILYNERNISS